ncbi:helix-turn-helix domain-containing protein [Pseudonocardia parietis]|uniref:AraC-like DNA-binding protein n=1 Tax=Pseudonocardia parietis TaxID=570936 RepID=A0ABS4VWN9_9PSEU|nr:helix-turn-helix domain-containing protein [Pseudonocardia parietis]MBP2368345.1 AraC-like DNA-binding protein [Pseudonocardia parietis]
MVGYREIAPARPVADLLECAWQSRTDAPHVQRVLPDGCMDLLVLGADAPGTRLVVAGPDTAAHLSSDAAGAVTTGLRFRPGALPALLGVPAEELRDTRTDLDAVLTGAVARTVRALTTARSLSGPGGAGGSSGAGGSDEGHIGAPRSPLDDAAVPLAPRDPALAVLLEVAAALRAGADEGTGRPLPAPLPPAALRALARGMAAGELADRLGVTSRTVHRRCVSTLGYGPALARRVLRFRRASALLFDGVPPAQVAARTGYADQPHLSREIRALAGVSPTALTAGHDLADRSSTAQPG